MGNRATCPVCGSYSSSVLFDIDNGKDCRECGCSNQHLFEYQEIEEKKEVYKKSKISKELIEQNERLLNENYSLKTKLKKIIEILGYDFDSRILEDLTKVLKILHDRD